MAYTHTNQPTGFVPNRRSVHQQSVRKWAILDDESENWSKNVEEFFVNGDSPFCYSGVFNTPLQLDRRFWGTLLGYTCNGYLTPEHIEGWVGRMMQWRRRQQQNEAFMRWSILPPRFFDYLVDGNTKNTVNFANGKSIPYPSFFDVDYTIGPSKIIEDLGILCSIIGEHNRRYMADQMYFWRCLPRPGKSKELKLKVKYNGIIEKT
ncbi:hypothetical protein R6Q57_028024 [Mikania cordata]